MPIFAQAAARAAKLANQLNENRTTSPPKATPSPSATPSVSATPPVSTPANAGSKDTERRQSMLDAMDSPEAQKVREQIRSDVRKSAEMRRRQEQDDRRIFGDSIARPSKLDQEVASLERQLKRKKQMQRVQNLMK
jgi:hypothetical protein